MKEHTSIILWRGKKFEFKEPMDDKAAEKLAVFFKETAEVTKSGIFDNSPDCNLYVDFHGAGLAPDTCSLEYIERSKGNNTVYYLPNNQPRENTGLFDWIVNKIIPHPSKQDAESNGKDAAQTLNKICEKMVDCQETISAMERIKPRFYGFSAGVNTMFQCVDQFLNNLPDNTKIKNCIDIRRKNIEFVGIPTSGYKSATQEESATLLMQIEKKISNLSNSKQFSKISHNGKDRELDSYCLCLRDNGGDILRFHNVKYTRRFLQCLDKLNQTLLPIEIKPSPAYAKTHKQDELGLMYDVQNRKYQTLKHLTVSMDGQMALFRKMLLKKLSTLQGCKNTKDLDVRDANGYLSSRSNNANNNIKTAGARNNRFSFDMPRIANNIKMKDMRNNRPKFDVSCANNRSREDKKYPFQR